MHESRPVFAWTSWYIYIYISDVSGNESQWMMQRIATTNSTWYSNATKYNLSHLQHDFFRLQWAGKAENKIFCVPCKLQSGVLSAGAIRTSERNHHQDRITGVSDGRSTVLLSLEELRFFHGDSTMGSRKVDLAWWSQSLDQALGFFL